MSKITPPHSFEGRIGIVGDEVVESSFWSYEFEPEGSRRTTADWAREHFGNYDVDDLREMFDLQHENVQVIFKATLTGLHDSFSGEYDDDLDIIESSQQRISDEMAGYLTGQPDPLDD